MSTIVERLRQEARFGWLIAANRQADTRNLHAEAADVIEEMAVRYGWTPCRMNMASHTARPPLHLKPSTPRSPSTGAGDERPN